MYSPRDNRVDDPAMLHAFVDAHPFAVLVSGGADGPEATHLPLLLDAHRGPHGTLVGHMARANDHWRALERDPRVLAVFHGPQAFVSAGWYAPPRAVSTWNYAAVHARGTARLVHEPEALHAFATRIRRAFDTPETQALAYDETLLRAIVGFEIEVTGWSARFKLSQDKDPQTHAQVVAHLEAEGGEAARVAALMKTPNAPGAS